MADNVPDPVETVGEVVETPDPPNPPAEDAPTNERPSWVDEILDTIRATAPDPVTPDPGSAPPPLADETPVRKPWTHWGRR